MSSSGDGPGNSQGRRRSSYLSAADFDFPSARGQVERESQRRMRRAVLQHRRYTPAQLQELDNQHDPASVRTALRHPVGYQGWAPGTSDNEAEEPEVTLGSLRSLVRRQTYLNQDSEATRRRREEAIDAELAERRRPLVTTSSAEWEQSHFIEDGSGGEPTTTESSLRTTALLQSVRRHARFSSRSRSQLESYILERERTGQANEDRERQSLTRLRRSGNPPILHEQQDQDSPSDVSVSMAAMQRARLNLQIENHPHVYRWLEEAIKYLERLRFCDTYSERISSATEGGFMRGEYFSHDHEDFILDTTTIDPPPQSSWLNVGGVFSGSQHAAAGNCLPTYQVTERASAARRTTGAIRPGLGEGINQPTWYNNVLAASTISSILPPDNPSSTTVPDDKWPVKVTINSIDYTTMTLAGTMEAFNVPRKTILPQESSITTFLEGEIIDFNRYTLETKSFSADASVDSTYWRKLEPFKGLSDKEVVACLVSTRWLREELGQKWILMRWKGEFSSFFSLSLSLSPFFFLLLSFLLHGVRGAGISCIRTLLIIAL